MEVPKREPGKVKAGGKEVYEHGLGADYLNFLG